MAQIWIEWTNEHGEEASCRWGGDVTDENIDDIISCAVKTMGRQPDTQTG